MMLKVWMNPAPLMRVAAVAMLVLLGACGGGTQVERFVPERVVAFGDENSVIDDSAATGNGVKYTVNGYNTATPPALDCTVYPIWIQYVAGQWNLRFSQCSSGVTNTSSSTYAVNGAKVAGLDAQFAQAGSLGSTVLATVFVGANDIFDIYANCIGCAEAGLIAQAEAAGTLLATKVAEITRNGAKVVFLTLPELGSTPYALAEEASNPGAASLLTRLTAAFNIKLRTGVSDTSSPSYIDGHQGVQVLADSLFRPIVAAGSTTTGYYNVVDGICDILATAAATTSCDTTTLRTSASTPALTTSGTPSNYLWADGKHLSPAGHSTLGTTAANRINANPL